ncbi:DUF2169 family type VI secretion system accessory protein [Sorangium sp. So ce854]|uniref:DUF2169 family type VI secretion system accessory protein n=1 Tax=Sorangium sp. So ce854 TaxID=3133322 RepID=UPI003F61C0BF
MRVLRTMAGHHAVAPMKNAGARDVLVVILKLTFAVDLAGRAELLDEDAADPDLVDTYNGDDAARSSIRRPSQLFDFKPGTDVILLGHAHPPSGRSVTRVDVSLRVGPVHKTVRAHGFRVWQACASGGLKPGPAQVIREPIPLIYELAWGGVDEADPMHPRGERRNYVGRGVAADPKSLVHQPAAQLEMPGVEEVPAAFNPIHRHWEPRCTYAGTYDQAWMETRMPLLPEDFDPMFHVCVPHDQWSRAPLRGDEPFEILGATPEGALRFRLPRITPGFSSLSVAGRAEHRTHLDTILVDADLRRVELTWRAAVPIPRKLEMLDHVRVFEKKLI